MSFTENIDEVVEENRNGLLGKHQKWRRVRLREVATILNGFPFESSRFKKDRGTPLIRIRDIVPRRTETFYDGNFDPAFLVKHGELLVGMDGDFNCEPWAGEPALLNQRVCKITPDESRYAKQFLRYILPGYLAAINERTPSVTVKHLSSRTVADIPLPVPTLSEQGQIVAEIEKQFTRLDAGVAALRRAQANLKRYRAAVLKAACEGRLVPTEAKLAKAENCSFETGEQLLSRIGTIEPSGTGRRRAGRLWGAGHVPELTDEERNALPIGWVWVKVRGVGFDLEEAVQVGPMSMKSADFTDDGVPVLNVGCVQWDRFDESKLDHLPLAKASEFGRYRIASGDVLFTRSGTVGRCAVTQRHQEGWLMTFHLLRVRPHPQKCLPAFLRIVFEGASHIRHQTKAASVGSTRAGFNTNLLASLDVPLPPMIEQLRIVAEVERRLSVIEELEAVVSANLQRAARLRQSILQEAFAGSILSEHGMRQPGEPAWPSFEHGRRTVDAS